MNIKLKSSQQSTNNNCQTEQLITNSNNVDATLNKAKNHHKSNHATINSLKTGINKLNPGKANKSVSSDETKEVSLLLLFTLYRDCLCLLVV